VLENRSDVVTTPPRSRRLYERLAFVGSVITSAVAGTSVAT